jgi:hypothetical protein
MIQFRLSVLRFMYAALRSARHRLLYAVLLAAAATLAVHYAVLVNHLVLLFSEC